jgi:hypothetical protein
MKMCLYTRGGSAAEAAPSAPRLVLCTQGDQDLNLLVCDLDDLAVNPLDAALSTSSSSTIVTAKWIEEMVAADMEKRWRWQRVSALSGSPTVLVAQGERGVVVLCDETNRLLVIDLEDASDKQEDEDEDEEEGGELEEGDDP